MTEKAFKLKSLLKRNKITTQMLQKETGYSLVHISRVLNGKVTPSMPFQKLLEHTLKKYVTVGKEEISDLLEELWNS